MIGLEWTRRRNAKIIGLRVGEARELDAQLLQMQTRHFLVESFRKYEEANLRVRSPLKKLNADGRHSPDIFPTCRAWSTIQFVPKLDW